MGAYHGAGWPQIDTRFVYSLPFQTGRSNASHLRWWYWPTVLRQRSSLSWSPASNTEEEKASFTTNHIRQGVDAADKERLCVCCCSANLRGFWKLFWAFNLIHLSLRSVTFKACRVCACLQVTSVCRRLFMCVPGPSLVCVCKMLAADGRGLGGVRVRGHSVRLGKWIAALLWSLAWL